MQPAVASASSFPPEESEHPGMKEEVEEMEEKEEDREEDQEQVIQKWEEKD